MTRLFILCALFTLEVLLNGCKTSSNQGSSIQTSKIEDVAHNSKNSLDWAGVYSGILPCADCDGIETVVTLTKDLTYHVDTRYKGKSGSTFGIKGKFSWSQDGTRIELQGIQSGTGPIHYQVGENHLVQLDMEGKKITGPMASRYILKKGALTDSNDVSNGKEIPLVGTKWRLVELRGMAVTKTAEGKEFSYLQLDKDGKVAAYAGCNRMFGGYELQDGLRIRFTGMASTRMACPDMQTEQILGEVLDAADNYSLQGNRMTLNKAKMAPLAVFEAE